MTKKPSTILAFDTATAMCSVALQAGDAFFLCEEIMPQKHAECILPMIEKLLLQAKIVLSDLDAIAFGCGPGSFIGVRIATAVAQSLTFAHDLPLISVSSLQALAQNAFQKNGAAKIAAAWDARMQAIYWGLFQEENGLMQPLQNELLSKPEEIQISADFLAVGNAWEAYRDHFSENFNARNSAEEFYPSAAAILKIAEYKLQKNEIISPLLVEPVYLRDDVARKMNK